MNTTSIAIIDIVGTPYDGNTLSKRGLGGSESAVVLMSKELVKVGFDITVFNNCSVDDCLEGTYDGVKFIDLTKLFQENNFVFDIVISSRTVIPFAPEKYEGRFNFSSSVFKKMVRAAKLKILWMHDTFCTGDELLEELVVDNHIDELFTLSDFHTTYITNCNHGRRRNFEVLKNRVFMTRNGIVNYLDEVDIGKKDKNLFVYNSSVSKGMVPLVEKVWPIVNQVIPEAKLKVIGGFYKFKNGEPDEQEMKWRSMVADPIHAQRNIEFTGIIKQNEIAEILSKASFMIYPAIFPETFGISTLESLNYNTPLITTRFGALEETAIEKSSYFIDYAVEPNSLFQDINSPNQIQKFVEAVFSAYNNSYLHQQKMYYCNIVKDVCEWSTIALQWKQHLFRKLGLFLSVEDYRKVSFINDKVHKIYGRRFSNPEEWNTFKSQKQNRIVVVSPFYNAQNYLEKCIDSVLQQDYENYKLIFIDDASTDNSVRLIEQVAEKYSDDFIKKIKVMINTSNIGALKNQVKTIRELEDDDIVILLDGDDWLVNDNNIFNFFNNIYNEGYEFTYGSCWSVVDNIPLISQPYPKEVRHNKTYRQHKFNWNIPYSHLRTFRKKLINDISDDEFKDGNGNWYRAGGDVALFYSLIEQADPEKIKVVQDIVYNYNDASPLNDYKINGDEQTRNANEIIAKKKMKTKKILIGIPTAKYVETATFKSIYDLDIPEGYETEIQFFYGYQIDQVRNLIANWAIHYDYLFSIDSDIVLPKDTLTKMISHDKDLISGLYIQRKPGEHILEIYMPNEYGGVVNIPYDGIKNAGLIEIAGCGFGCVLVKSHVIREIGYPQFVYKSALNHKDTISEDVYFCTKAREKGFKIFADTSILCDHIGSTTFKV